MHRCLFNGMIIRSICYAIKMGLLDLIIHKVQGCMYHRGRPCGCYMSRGEGPHLRLFMSLGGEDFFLQVKLAIVTKTLHLHIKHSNTFHYRDPHHGRVHKFRISTSMGKSSHGENILHIHFIAVIVYNLW